MFRYFACRTIVIRVDAPCNYKDVVRLMRQATGTSSTGQIMIEDMSEVTVDEYVEYLIEMINTLKRNTTD